MQQGRLARAARAHDGHDLAAGNGQVGAPQGRRLAEGPHDVAGFDQVGRGSTAEGLWRSVRRLIGVTTSASETSRASVTSIQRRSASRWNMA